MINDADDSNMQGTGNNIKTTAVRRHPTYWLEDGSLILQIQNIAYKLHRTLITRHSPVLQSLTTGDTEDGYSVSALRIPDELGILSEDFERLLEHLYHDIPLDSNCQLARLGSILRVSSERQLHFLEIHNLARQRLQSLYPKTLADLSYPQLADQALGLAVQYRVYSIQKGLYYGVATKMHLEDHNTTSNNHEDGSHVTELLAAAVVPQDVLQRCKDLLDQLIGHFTPILFTVATAGHMECTNVLAETWMPLVIQPALENNGLCRPIETLQSIIDLDWSTHGLCHECIGDKREEWKTEQQAVWDKMENWLGLQDQVNKDT